MGRWRDKYKAAYLTYEIARLERKIIKDGFEKLRSEGVNIQYGNKKTERNGDDIWNRVYLEEVIIEGVSCFSYEPIIMAGIETSKREHRRRGACFRLRNRILGKMFLEDIVSAKLSGRAPIITVILKPEENPSKSDN